MQFRQYNSDACVISCLDVAEVIAHHYYHFAILHITNLCRQINSVGGRLSFLNILECNDRFPLNIWVDLIQYSACIASRRFGENCQLQIWNGFFKLFEEFRR